ncbi:hypothetical protein MBAV_000794, partial [Candidatus Magnetobacterium bavaricum]
STYRTHSATALRGISDTPQGYGKLTDNEVIREKKLGRAKALHPKKNKEPNGQMTE